MRRGSSAVASAQWPEWHQLAILPGVAERDVEPAQLDQQAQVLDVGLAVLAIVVVPSGARGSQPERS